jgi:hypothetical protein
MKSTIRGVLACGVLLLVAATPARSGATASPVLEKYSFSLGGYFMDTRTQVRVDDAESDRGTEVDFEKDLGFGDNDELLRFEANWVFKGRHQLGVGYFDLNRTSTRTLDREIEWGDETFPVSAEVDGLINMKALDFGYTYWLMVRERSAFGLSFGIQYLGLDADAALSEDQLQASADLAVDAPVPLLGFEWRHSLGSKFLFKGGGKAVYVENLDDIKKARIFSGYLALEHRTFEHAGVGLAFRSLDYRIDVERRLVAGRFGYRLAGAELYLTARF